MKAYIKYLIIIVLAFMAGIAFEYWFLTKVWPNRHRSYSWVYSLRKYKKLGEPCKTDQVLNRKGYSLGYSYEYKSALWVSYILSAGSTEIDSGRHGSFYADKDIPEEYRVQPEQHTNTEYDRGHLAPSATIDFSPEANRETFALSNVVPQAPRLNRQAWEKLESLERKWAKTKGKLHVVTGPLYSSRPRKVNDLKIPSRFYKVIYSYDEKKAIGFIMPNKAVSDSDLWRYAMSVQEVEAETGLHFFSALSQKKQDALKANLDLEWWKGQE